jgi:hypothetical protein
MLLVHNVILWDSNPTVVCLAGRTVARSTCPDPVTTGAHTHPALRNRRIVASSREMTLVTRLDLTEMSPCALVHAMPIRAVTIGGEEVTCSQSTRST